MNKKFLTGLATALMTTVGTTALIGISLQGSQASDSRDKVSPVKENMGFVNLLEQKITLFRRKI